MPTTPSDLKDLKPLAALIAQACPDLRQLARDLAQTLLDTHGLADLDPDEVFWHRFDTAQSSPRTFSGWCHDQPPLQTMTLPQLVMRRFDPHDQDNADLLQVNSGFYSNPGTAPSYDEHNEIRLLPKDVMDELWAQDFATNYRKRLVEFWDQHAENFRVLAKANCLSQALQALKSKAIARQDFDTLTQALAGPLFWPVDLATLSASHRATGLATLRTFSIGEHTASDILRIVEPGGRQYLYVPGEQPGFHAFDSDVELHFWVLMQTNHRENRARFMTHFADESHASNAEVTGLNHSLDLLFSTWGKPDVSLLNQRSAIIDGDAFTWLRDSMHQRMLADAQFNLRSNSDLRKRMWVGYLKAFNQLAGGLAALDWPVALACLGGGLAELGLDIDQAVNGHDTAERRQGLTNALVEAIDMLINLGALVAIGALSDTPQPPEVEDPAEPIAAQFNTGQTLAIEPVELEPYSHEDLAQRLSPFETNVIYDAAAVGTEGRLKGIYRTGGDFYIELNDRPYQVRFVNELRTWVIVDPTAPYSFYRNIPVGLNAGGEWELTPLPGLKGGMLKFLSRFKLGPKAPEALIETPYEVPAPLRPALARGARGLEDKLLSGDYAETTSGDTSDHYESFRSLRDKLLEDAEAFYRQLTPHRTVQLPQFGEDRTTEVFFRGFFEACDGVVIGEIHSSIASKKLLINSMKLLARQNVKTLYMEHLLQDFHQADLDAFFDSGAMSSSLRQYVQGLDIGFRTDPAGRYTFLELILQAHRNGIRIQALDCMASYRLAGITPNTPARLKMMNYYAHLIIQADAQNRSGRWIALVGNAHAGSTSGIEGLDRIENVISLRAVDVAENAPTGISQDTGAFYSDGVGERGRQVRADYLFRSATLPPTSPHAPQRYLTQANSFYIERTADRFDVVYRREDATVHRLPIRLDGDSLYILSPRWPQLNEVRYRSVSALAAAVAHTGMSQTYLFGR